MNELAAGSECFSRARCASGEELEQLTNGPRSKSLECLANHCSGDGQQKGNHSYIFTFRRSGDRRDRDDVARRPAWFADKILRTHGHLAGVAFDATGQNCVLELRMLHREMLNKH